MKFCFIFKSLEILRSKTIQRSTVLIGYLEKGSPVSLQIVLSKILEKLETSITLNWFVKGFGETGGGQRPLKQFCQRFWITWRPVNLQIILSKVLEKLEASSPLGEFVKDSAETGCQQPFRLFCQRFWRNQRPVALQSDLSKTLERLEASSPLK